LPLLNADPPTGTHVYLLKNSRLGLPAQVPIWEPGFPVRNLQNALGLPASVRQTRVGSRCSGKERDQETGLDYFQARYYSGAQGRFTSPDEFKGGIVDPLTGQDIETNTALPYADIGDPQTLNKYMYVRNNPLRYVDPDGHDFGDWLQTGAEFVEGVARGGAASVSMGAVGAPSSSDTLASRIGQAVGAGVVGFVGTNAAEAGVVGGVLTSPSGVGAVAGGAVAVAGVAAAVGAVKELRLST
jgi:RHS repeat-associated protein